MSARVTVYASLGISNLPVFIFLFFLLGSTILSSCAYPSFYEASYSCTAWVKKGASYSGVIKAIKKDEQTKGQIDHV